MQDGAGSDELGLDPRFYRLRDDRIVIMVVEYHKLLAAVNGCDVEAAILVHGDFTSQFDCFNKKMVGSE